MSDFLYQHALTVAQAENDIAYGKEFGNPQMVRAAEKRIAAAKAAKPQEKKQEEPEAE